MSKKSGNDFSGLLNELAEQSKLLAKAGAAEGDAEEHEEEEEEEVETTQAGGKTVVKSGKGKDDVTEEEEEEEETEDSVTKSGPGDEEEEEEEEDDPKINDRRLGKSMTLKDDKGRKVQAFDGLPLLKSVLAATRRLGAGHVTLEKNQEGIGKVLKAVTQQNKALTEGYLALKKSVDALADVGRGRKSALVTVIGGDTQGKGGLKPQEFLAKAQTANRAGKITALDVSLCENYINRGTTPPAELVTKVLAAA